MGGGRRRPPRVKSMSPYTANCRPPTAPLVPLPALVSIIVTVQVNSLVVRRKLSAAERLGILLTIRYALASLLFVDFVLNVHEVARRGLRHSPLSAEGPRRRPRAGRRRLGLPLPAGRNADRCHLGPSRNRARWCCAEFRIPAVGAGPSGCGTAGCGPDRFRRGSHARPSAPRECRGRSGSRRSCSVGSVPSRDSKWLTGPNSGGEGLRDLEEEGGDDRSVA
jgi:hypothetical protein